MGGGSFHVPPGLGGLGGPLPAGSALPGLPSGLRGLQRALPQHCAVLSARCSTHPPPLSPLSLCVSVVFSLSGPCTCTHICCLPVGAVRLLQQLCDRSPVRCLLVPGKEHACLHLTHVPDSIMYTETWAVCMPSKAMMGSRTVLCSPFRQAGQLACCLRQVRRESSLTGLSA